MIREEYTSPPIANESNRYERQRQSLATHKNQREFEQQMGVEEQLSPTLFEEQQLNDYFYSNQKKRMTKRPKSPRKNTIRKY